MAQQTYTPFNWFWFGLVPAVLIGVAVYVGDSGGFLAQQVRELFGSLAKLLF